MRKIEQEMVEAIKFLNNWSKSNTRVRVCCADHTRDVYLHNNLIAQIDYKKGEVCLRSCGWKTNTTKSRLNAICDMLGMPGICQENYEWYLGCHKFVDGGVYNFRQKFYHPDRQNMQRAEGIIGNIIKREPIVNVYLEGNGFVVKASEEILYYVAKKLSTSRISEHVQVYVANRGRIETIQVLMPLPKSVVGYIEYNIHREAYGERNIKYRKTIAEYAAKYFKE